MIMLRKPTASHEANQDTANFSMMLINIHPEG
jgi:hypothetical protein